MKRWQKIALSIVALFAVPALALAATIQSGNTYSLASGETLDGALYAAAGTVNVDGTVNGDVVVTGGTVTISGTVNGDVLAAGGTVSVIGSISGDVRITGGQLTIATTVPGDVNAAGGSLTLESSSVVQGDVLAAGGDQMLHGRIEGQLRVAGGNILIDGPVNGNVRAYVGMLELSDKAALGGDLRYTSEKEAKIADGASIAGVTEFDKETYQYGMGLLGIGILAWVIKFAALLTAALVFAAGFKKYTTHIVAVSRQQMGKQLITGLLVLVVTPIVFGILLATVLGSLLGIVLLAFYILLMLMGYIYAGIIFGALMMRYLKKGYPENGDWISALLGVIVLQLIALIPVLGWLVALFLFVLALGTLSTHKWMMLRGHKE